MSALAPDRRSEHASAILLVPIFLAMRLWTDMFLSGHRYRGGKYSLPRLTDGVVSSHHSYHAVDTLNREEGIDCPRFMTLSSRGPAPLLLNAVQYMEMGLRLL